MWDEGQAGGDGGGATRGRIVCSRCCHRRGLSLVKQTNKQDRTAASREQAFNEKDKPAPEQQKHKEQHVDNEILHMLVEGMVGDSKQAQGRDQGDEGHGHKEKTRVL